MKKILCLMISAIMVIGIISSLPLNSLAAAKKISLKKSSATLRISKKNGKAVYGSTTINVKKAKGVAVKKVTYKSSDKKIAKVTSKGKVTAKKQGKAKIAVNVKYKFKKRTYTKSLTFKVTVTDVRPVSTTAATEPAETATAEPAGTTATESTETEATEETQSQTEPAQPETQPTQPETQPTQPETQPTQPETQPEEDAKTKALNNVTGSSGNVYSFSDAATLNKLSEFSDKLYEMSSKDETGNYTMSPVSVYMALSMLYSIGDDGVKSDISQLTGMTDSDIKKTAELFNYLSKEYKNQSGETVSRLNLTNSIWLNTGLQANPDVLNSLASDFFCSAFETPFSQNNKLANKDIRDFIKKNTNGLIDQDFDLSEETLFALINTLYFKDAWGEGDLPTQQKPFKLSNGSVTTEFLIGQYYDGQVQENDCCRYFYTETSYGYRVKFILPKDGYTLKQAMSADNLNKVVQDKDYDAYDSMYNHLTRCIFPKFKIESDTPLKSILENNRLLSNTFRSFYSPLISDGRALLVSDIKHKTVLNVDKKGVEGAAVTIIAAEPTSCDPSYEKHYDFVLDSEFGFVITNNRDDVVLFEGQVTNP